MKPARRFNVIFKTVGVRGENLPLKVFFKGLLPLGIVFFTSSCGKKAPPQPPTAEPISQTTRKVSSILSGKGGYLLSSNGVALYWSFPVAVDYSRILMCGSPPTDKNCKVVATKVVGYSFLYPVGIKEKTVFRVLGIKGGKTVAEAVIEVKP